MNGLPVDPFVLNLLQQKETMSAYDPNNVKCGCEEEAALVYCNDCGAFFGEKCLKNHKKGKITLTHSPMTVDDYFKESGPGSRRMFCQTHPTLEVDSFCKQCQQATCPSCGVESHGSHQGLVKLLNLAADFSRELIRSAGNVHLCRFPPFVDAQHSSDFSLGPNP